MSVVIRGQVTVKVHGMLKQKQLPGTWGVLHDGGNKANKDPRIELFESKTASSPAHVILLQSVKFSDKSYRQEETFFMLSIKREKHQFQFGTVEDKEDWVQSLCHVSQDLWKQHASSRESSEMEESEENVDMSDNLLYETCDNVQQFKVSVHPNKASDANKLQGHYMLNPTRDALRLLEIDNFKSIHEWPYRQIRKYGCTRNIFKMEVGRRCTTGEGDFEFFTPDGSTLSSLIGLYTKQMFSQEVKETKSEPAPCDEGEYVESLTRSSPTPQQPAPRRPSETTKEAESKDIGSSQKGSRDAKRDAPKPTPRTSVGKSKKQNGSSGSGSSDTKIYETSSGLTAPLSSQLKQELHTKLQVNPQDSPSSPSRDSHPDIEDDTASISSETSSDMRESSENAKDKKKSEKERKKLEKEKKAAEAKQRKQEEKEQKEREKRQEKEMKEQREREAKEEKERLKKMKKESKGHDKLQSKKSFDAPAPMPASASDGHIYDEPGELLQASKAKPTPTLPADPSYCEADEIVAALPKPSKSPTLTPTPPTGDVYATPQKPKKDSWKTAARPESQHVHEENYNSLKGSASQPKSRPPIPPYPQPSDAEDDTYNRLGDIRPASHPVENIYGIASAKQTMQASRPPPVSAFEGGNEYEEADFMAAKPEARPVRDEYEEPGVPRPAAIKVNIPDEGEYADVS